MGIVVKVNSVDVSTKWQRAAATNWDDPLNGRGTGRIQFADVAGGFTPEDGQTFEIIDGSVTAFAGVLMEPTLTEPEATGTIFFDCQLADYNMLADRRNVSDNYSDLAFELIVSGIVTDHMDGEGISLAGVEPGPALSSDNPNIKATASFNALSDATGRAWFIDPDKVLNFRDRLSLSAPADLDGDTVLLGTPRVRTDRQMYRNEQIIKAGTDEFPIFVLSGRLSEIADRAAKEGTSGIYSDVQVFPEILNQDVAFEKAGDLLDRFARITKVVEAVTRTPGFRAGQAVNVNLPKQNIVNEVMLIDSVQANVITVDDGPGDTQEIWYTVRAITGDPFGGWMQHFRKAPPVKGPLRFQNDPGLFRVDPTPGVVIHDPIPGPFEWFQAATTVPTKFANVFGLTNDGLKLVSFRVGGLANTDGCGGGLFPGFGGSPACFANRQFIAEIYTIDGDNLVSTTPTSGNSIDRPNAGANSKAFVPIAADDDFALASMLLTPGVDSAVMVYDLRANAFRGQVVSTMLTNSNHSEPAWVGDVVYFVDGSGSTIFIYDLSDPDNPTETTSSSSVTTARSIVASPDGSVLYVLGPGTKIAALDISNPLSPVEDTVLTIVGGYRSLDIRPDGTALLMFRRFDGSTFRWTSITMSLNGTDIAISTNDGSIAQATTVMDGLGLIWPNGTTAICWSEIPTFPVNSLRGYVFDATNIDVVTLEEIFEYNHGGVSNAGPFRSLEAAKAFFWFGGVNQQITFGEALIEEPVPLTIDNPLRFGFGGTGLGNAFKGDLFYADRTLPDDERGHGELARLSAGQFCDVLTISGELPVYQDLGELAAFCGVGAGGDVRFTTSDLLVASGVLQDLTELEAEVTAGTTYYFRAELFYDADTNLGHRYSIGGTATGDVRYQIRCLDDSSGEYSIITSGQKIALGESAGVEGIMASGRQTGYTEISGSISVSADGTIVPQFGVF